MSSRLLRTATVTLAGLACAGAVRAAAPAPTGAPFRVISCTTCRSDAPRIAGTKAGGFLTTWDGSTSTDPKAVSGRVFTANGNPRGGDLRIAVDPAINQFDSAVAATTQGKFVVVWSSVAGANSTDMDVWARRYQSTGVPIDPAPIPVNVDDPALPVPPSDYLPAVAPTKDGGFVVTWFRVLPPHDTSPGGQPQIFARRFAAAGTPLAKPVLMSAGLTGEARPDVCVDSRNQAIVTWSSLDRDEPFLSSKYGVVARRLSPTSSPVGGVVTVAAPKATPRPDPAIACLAGGIFAISWQSDQAPATDSADILARRFTQLGRPIGAALRVNTHAAGFQRRPAISQDATGKVFVIVWDVYDSTPNPTVVGIYGRSYTSGGVAQGSDFVVLEKPRDADELEAPDVAHVGTAGQFVVVWQTGDETITGRRYKPGS